MLLVSSMLFCQICFFGCGPSIDTSNPIHKKSNYRKQLRKKAVPESVGITPEVRYEKWESSYKSTIADDSIYDAGTLQKSAVVFNKNGDLFYLSETHKDSLADPNDPNTSIDYLYKTKKNKYKIWKHYKMEGIDTFLTQAIEIKADTLIISESSAVGYRNWSYYIKKNESN